MIGVSPATSELEHVKKYKLPIDYHDIIIYTGFGYSGRNLLLTRASDAVLVSCGRMGTLNEFTISFEDDKVIGVLTETGGMADEIESILEKAHRGKGKVIFDSDPRALIEKVIEMVKKVTGVDFPVKIGSRRPGDADELVADTAKIKKELGWIPRYSDLETVVKTAWQWHKSHPEGYQDNLF